MKIAVFGTTVSKRFLSVLDDFFGFLQKENIEVQLFLPFYTFLKERYQITPYHSTFFSSPADFDPDNQFLFSVGGDGTFLHSLVNSRNFDIPVIGVNGGRLGFLADISQEQIHSALTDIFNFRYTIINRSLLEVEFCGAEQMDFNYALNELAVLKTDSSSMINISARCDNQLLNNYWADGLIVATPTGSTAYSLSVGGPILTPDSENFVITPLAPHNLTIRPVVVPDKYEIELKVDGRQGSHYLTSLDYRSVPVEFSTVLKIRKAKETLKTLQLPQITFFNTLRNKLMWGFDKRN
jgi:NAD+ kinase